VSEEMVWRGGNAAEKKVMAEAVRLKVGELARRTGSTVRTLHHYEEVGLLTPSERTASGHRLYRAEDVERLQRIRSLQQLGFSLEQIRDSLSDPGFSPLGILRLHQARVAEQRERLERLQRRLERLVEALERAEAVAMDDLLQLIEAMNMYEKYDSTEQVEMLRQRAEQLGAERIREVEAEWPRLMAEVRAEMEKGTDPADPRVRDLAERWRALVAEFTGGDQGIERSLFRGAVQAVEQSADGLDGHAKRPQPRLEAPVGGHDADALRVFGGTFEDPVVGRVRAGASGIKHMNALMPAFGQVVERPAVEDERDRRAGFGQRDQPFQERPFGRGPIAPPAVRRRADHVQAVDEQMIGHARFR